MPEIVFLQVGRRETTKVRNRQAILEAARNLFAELGFETCTVRDIVRRAGLGSGTFYNYYHSKEEVYAALSEEGARLFSPRLRSMRADAADWESFLRAAIHAYFEFLAGEHRAWVAQQPDTRQRPIASGETPEATAVFREVRQAIVDELSRGDPTGVDPDYLAAACIGVARDVGALMIRRRPVDTAAAADFVVSLIMDGVSGLPQLATE